MAVERIELDATTKTYQVYFSEPDPATAEVTRVKKKLQAIRPRLTGITVGTNAHGRFIDFGFATGANYAVEMSAVRTALRPRFAMTSALSALIYTTHSCRHLRVRAINAFLPGLTPPPGSGVSQGITDRIKLIDISPITEDGVTVNIEAVYTLFGPIYATAGVFVQMFTLEAKVSEALCPDCTARR